MFRYRMVCASLFFYVSVASALPLSNPLLWFPATQNSIAPGAYLSSGQKPLPTNAWFINLFLKDAKAAWTQPVNVFPYLLRVGSQGLNISYTAPWMYAEPSNPDIISALYYPFGDTLVLGAVESTPDWKITPTHGAGIQIAWQNRMSSPILQGSPYITLFYNQSTPHFFSRFRVQSVNGSTQHGAMAADARFELVLELDTQKTQTWVLYSETPVVLEWVTKPDGEHLQAQSPFQGWLRLVLQKDTEKGIDNDAGLLDACSKTIPLGHQEILQTRDGRMRYLWKWQTQDQKAPLLLTLPHQRPVADSRDTRVRYRSIKGELQGIVQAQWQMELPALSVEFLEPRRMGALEKDALRTALKEETDALLHFSFPDDGPYRMGKRFARAARLALIAHTLQEKTLEKQLLKAIHDTLKPLLTTKARWHFQYDTTWGGIIPDVDDYGARHYNDHHFHYGYWVYTFAVMAQLNPTWLKTPIGPKGPTPKDWIEVLIRDYANPNPLDPWFPYGRHMDEYAGHSWASGLTASENGQNQQSSSEAVNAYYALALYGKVSHDEELAAWGHFLLARELLAAQTYWQIQEESVIYPEAFRKDNQVVATLWDSKVDANAFFKPCDLVYRCGLEYAYGIQMLPFTAITPQLLNPAWLQQTRPLLRQLLDNTFGRITSDWHWILVKGLSIVMTDAEKSRYFQKVIDSKIDEYDNGDSKTNTLYFLLPQD